MQNSLLLVLLVPLCVIHHCETPSNEAAVEG